MMKMNTLMKTVRKVALLIQQILSKKEKTPPPKAERKIRLLTMMMKKTTPLRAAEPRLIQNLTPLKPHNVRNAAKKKQTERKKAL